MRPTPEQIDMHMREWHSSSHVAAGADANKWWQLCKLLSKLIGSYAYFRPEDEIG